MKKFEKNIDDRKVLVARLSELTGLDSHYTRVPRCAYEVGDFTVEKDGRLTVEDGADEGILETLASEGLIGVCIEESAPAAQEPVTEGVHAEEQPLPIDLGTEDWGNEEWEDDGGATEATQEEEQEIWHPETDIFARETETAEVTEETTTETEEATDSAQVPDAESMQEADEPVENADAVDERTGLSFPLDAQISFPLSRHTVASLTNLICMIHTRGPLLSKATRGNFYADKDLVDDILDRHTFTRPAELIGFVQDWTGSENPLEGISFDEEKVTFDGFTEVKDAEHLRTFMKLAAAMNKMAQTQKRVQAKETNDSNEKYSLRTWLLRLGMNGPDYKEERKILMEHLTGHAAFRTKADEEKWKMRQQAKKLALKAAKEDAGSEG